MANCFSFNKDNFVKCVSEGEKHSIYRNDKLIYSFCGTYKNTTSTDKKGNILSVVFKIKDIFNHTYFIIFTEDKNYVRKTVLSVVDNLVKFSKDKKPFIKKVEKL